ncbi:hypothetical protein D1871_17605 [Nakamurella silvestris]|nr:hypothetical protein D1871_17605 [Nakamurella silvestris]
MITGLSARWFGVLIAAGSALGVVPVGVSAAPAAVLASPEAFPPDTPAADLPTAVAWGRNDHGQLGDGTTIARSAPVQVDAGTALDGLEVSAVDTDSTHTCALAVGRVYCWGNNGQGDTGTGSESSDVAAPTQVKGALAGRWVSQLSVGWEHACAVAEGQAYCWGGNSSGPLGTGDNQSSPTPVPVSTTGLLKGRTVSAISAGQYHTCAIAEGAAYCWGNNTTGQLGDGTNATSTSPVAVSTAGGLDGLTVTAIAAGTSHTCATADGRVFCWGSNKSGQLGNGSKKDSNVPMPVDASSPLKGVPIKSLAVGGSQSCVVAGTNGGRFSYCWGEGSGGQLGNGGNTASGIPIKVATPGQLAGADISSISVHAGGGCEIAKGRGFCWGDAAKAGALGTNGFTSSTVPVPVYTSGVLSDRVLLTVNADYNSSAGIAVTTPTFSDVPANYPFVDDIRWLAGSGIARGFDNGTFQPSVDIDRQAMAAFLFRFLNPGAGDPACTGEVRRFTDVPKSNQFCGAVEWLTSAGITPAGGKFGPTAVTTRATMADWLFRAHHPDTADRQCAGDFRLFADVTLATPQCGNIEWLAKAGVTNGFADGTYLPGQAVHRDSMAAFMHREQELTSH